MTIDYCKFKFIIISLVNNINNYSITLQMRLLQNIDTVNNFSNNPSLRCE